MEYNNWEVLLTLYEEKNITKTAEKLYISQPAITYRIQQIEKDFNTKIITRGKKGVVFTTQGEYLVNYAKEMMTQLRKTKDHIQNMKKTVQGILRLGVSSNFALYRLPALLKRFLDLYPDVEINVKTGWSSEVLHYLQKEEVQVAILRGDHSWTDEQQLLFEEGLYIVSKERIDLRELPDKGRINYKTDYHLKNTIDNWWYKQFSKPPLVTMDVDRIETCKELVKKGLGYAIFPSISLNHDENLHTIKLKNGNKMILRPTWLLYRKSSLELSVINAFVNFIHEEHLNKSTLYIKNS